MTLITTTPATTHSHGTARRGLGSMAGRFEDVADSRATDAEVSRAQSLLNAVCMILAGLLCVLIVALVLVNGPKVIRNVAQAFEVERLNH